jgi:uncharacterized protein (TIGR03067 family)
MRMFIVAMIVLGSALWIQTGPDQAAAADPKKDEAQSELKKLQGLWQTSPGGIEHRDGSQIVRNPVIDGPCFYIRGDRLIWLDEDGKPTGMEKTITLDVKSDPRQITLTPVDGKKDDKPSHGIYSATDSSLMIHLGLDGGPAPKQFLELNKPIKGVDGHEWLVSRKRLKGE